jgi:hypothetical protein
VSPSFCFLAQSITPNRLDTFCRHCLGLYIYHNRNVPEKRIYRKCRDKSAVASASYSQVDEFKSRLGKIYSDLFSFPLHPGGYDDVTLACVTNNCFQIFTNSSYIIIQPLDAVRTLHSMVKIFIKGSYLQHV